MIDTEAIRKRILDIAISGQLGLNNLNESAPTVPDVDEKIDDTEKVFSIPSNWRWAKIGWVMSIERGGSPRPIKSYLTDSEDGINWIKIGDVEKGGKYILQTKEKIKPEGEKKSRRVYPGDFLLTNSMSFGRPYISKIQGCVHDGWLILRNTNGLFYYDFLYHLLSSSYMYAQFTKKATGSTVDNLNIDKVADAVIPVPPIEEQKRIVERIELLLSNVDQIEDLQQQYTSHITSLNKRILDLAVRGKLVSQDPNDEPASVLLKKIAAEKQKLIKEGKIKNQKTLPTITEDEIPFDIPESWEWARLGDICKKITDGTHHSPPNTEAGDYMYVTAKNIKNAGVVKHNITYVSKDIHEEIFARCNPEKGDVLLIKDGATTGVVTVNNIDEPFSMLSSVALLKQSQQINPWYLVAVLRSDLFNSNLRIKMKGTGITRITLNQIIPIPIPIPPLFEQNRIVERLFSILNAISNAEAE